MSEHKLKLLVKASIIFGFSISAEGWNGEYSPSNSEAEKAAFFTEKFNIFWEELQTSELLKP